PFLIWGEEGKPFRITGFTFNGTAEAQTMINISGTCKNFRVDHCRFINCARSIEPTGYTYGVMDHCEIDQYQGSHITGFSAVGEEPNDTWSGNNAWKRPLTLGSDNAVY